MRAFEFLTEKVAAAPATTPQLNAGNLLGLKQDVLSMLDGLQPGKDTRRILEKVKELLARNNATDNLGAYASRVTELGLKDQDVSRAIEQLTNLIAAAAEQTSLQDREFFFKKWSADQIVKVDALLAGDKIYKMSELFEYYGKSKAITFIVNALTKEAGYGLGKGELLLALLSQRINKAPGKGDLLIDGKTIEVKATHGGSPRFADQEVRVGSGYEQQRDLIIQKYAPQIKALGGLGKTGLNIDKYIQLGQQEGVNTAAFAKDTAALVDRIFDGKVDAGPLLAAIKAGKAGTAKGLFANMTFTRYMDIKQDDAVLYINLAAKEPTYVTFKTVDDLEKLGLYLHAETIYILGMSGNRDVFPQMAVKSTPQTNTEVAAPVAAKTKGKAKVAAPVAPVPAAPITKKAVKPLKQPAPAGIPPSKNTTSMQGTSMVSNPSPEPQF